MSKSKGTVWKPHKTNEARLAWSLVTPTALIVFGLVIFPAIFNIWVSFHNVGLHNLNDVFHAPFVRFENYKSVFQDFSFKFQSWDNWGGSRYDGCLCFFRDHTFDFVGLDRSIAPQSSL